MGRGIWRRKSKIEYIERNLKIKEVKKDDVRLVLHQGLLVVVRIVRILAINLYTHGSHDHLTKIAHSLHIFCPNPTTKMGLWVTTSLHQMTIMYIFQNNMENPS